MRTLVINLTRFGDLLQTQPTFTELKRAGEETALVCLDNFQGAAALLRHVDAVFPLPGGALLAGLEADWKHSLAGLASWRGELSRRFAADRVVNLTPTVPCRTLSLLLARGAAGSGSPAEIRGFGLDAHGFRADSSPWAAFLEAAAVNRGLSPFNLVDLFRKTAGLGLGPGEHRLREPGANALEAARALLSREAPAGAARFVAFQMGASLARRQWPVEHFALLAESLWEKYSMTAVLVGGKGEEELGRRFAAVSRAPAVNLIGRTNLEELAAVLGCAAFLVSNDTGTMHLAAGLDLPTVAIFLSTAQPFDTGPYRPGCLCLEPDLPCHPCAFGTACPRDMACLREIPAATVFAAVSAFLDQGRFPAGAHPGARAWETAMEADGFMGLRSLSGHDASDRAAWIAMQRFHYRQFLDEAPVFSPFPGRERLEPEAAGEVRAVLELSEGLLTLLAQQGAALSRLPRPILKDKFLTTWRRLRDLWLESRHFPILGHLWAHSSQESGQDLSAFLGLAARLRELLAVMGATLESEKNSLAQNL